MKNIFIAIFATVILFASCKVTGRIHFNKNNSGTVNFATDISSSLYSKTDSAKIAFSDSLIQTCEKYKSFKGVKNYKVFIEEDALKMSYDFDDLNGLNISLKEMMKENGTNFYGEFSSDKSTIYYKTPIAEENQIVDEAADMTTLDLTFSFDKKIISCDNTAYRIDEKNHTMEIDGTTTDFASRDMMNFSVKLK